MWKFKLHSLPEARYFHYRQASQVYTNGNNQYVYHLRSGHVPDNDMMHCCYAYAYHFSAKLHSLQWMKCKEAYRK